MTEQKHPNLFDKTSKETAEEFLILGEKFPTGEYPMLYRRSQMNKEWLEEQIQSVADAWHEGDIVSACQALESDLQHG